MFNTKFFENSAVYEIVWKNTEEPDRPQMAVLSIRIGSWANATNTHPELLTFIAFPLQKWLNERASVLRFKYIAPLFFLPPPKKNSLMFLKYSHVSLSTAVEIYSKNTI
jgi:hypothetical protein